VNLPVINTIVLVIVFAFAYAQGGLVAKAKGSVVTIPCSKVIDRNSISNIQTEKIVITGACPDHLDLSYLRTDSSLVFIAVKAREINLDNARLGGSLEIQDSFIDTITAIGAEIAFDLTIYSTLVKDQEKRDGDNHDDDDNGCEGFNIANRTRFNSLSFGKARIRSATFLGLEIKENISLAGAHVSGPVTLLLSKAHTVDMQHLDAESLDINSCESDYMLIAQAKIDRSLVLECSDTNNLQLWFATVGQAINLQGTKINILDAFSLECANLELSTIRTDNDLSLDLAFSHLKLLAPPLQDGIVYKSVNAEGLVVDAFRIPGASDKANVLKNFEKFVDAGAKSDLTFPVRTAKVLASSGQISFADRTLRYGSWLNVIRSYVGQAGPLLVVVPVLSILLAWFVLEYSIRKSSTNVSTPPGPHTGIECLLLSIDLFIPSLVALGVQSKHEEYLKKLTWQGTSLLVLYRLFGWACVSAILLWVSLRWSY
jgi:hypothetical protein